MASVISPRILVASSRVSDRIPPWLILSSWAFVRACCANFRILSVTSLSSSLAIDLGQRGAAALSLAPSMPSLTLQHARPRLGWFIVESDRRHYAGLEAGGLHGRDASWLPPTKPPAQREKMVYREVRAT